MDQEKYMEDLREIRDIMQRSSKFLSLSGLSGIAVGIIALVGAWLAFQLVFRYFPNPGYQSVSLPAESLFRILVIAFGTLGLSLGAGIFFTVRETKKRKQNVWDHQSRRLAVNLAIPLSAGGVVCLSFLLQGFIGLLPPLTLIFYGLALLQASKYTLDEIRSLGLIQLALGLFGMYFPAWGLWLWMLGFGALHIIYGIIIPLKYRS